MSYRCTVAVLLGVVLAGAQPLAAQCTPRALIIGVSTYKDPEFTVLPHARDDAAAFRDWLQNTTCGNGVRSNRPVVSTLTDEQATQTAIMRELSRVLLSAGRDDEVFIFISGRGLKTPDYSEGYLLGYDAVRGKLHPSGVTVQNLKDVVPARGVSRVFLFADISRDLPDRNQIVTHLQANLAGNPVLGAVLSAHPKQLSTEGIYPQGLFTHFLMEELKASPGKRISLDSIYQSLRRKVLDATKSKQEPLSFGDQGAVVELFPREQVLLAAVKFLPRGALALQQLDPDPPQAGSVDALNESFRLEQEAQLVLLRYGEGNQFPDDPLRPGPAEFDRAADLFDQALQTRPALPVKELDDRLRASLTARSLFCRGRALAYRSQYDHARQILEQARAADPLLPEPYNAIGITYLEQAQYKAAVDAFRESIRVAPDWAYPRHNLALTYIEMGDNAAAEAEYRAAIKRAPQHPYLYYNLGVLLQRINRRAETEQLFLEAIAKFEQQAATYRRRAMGLNTEDPGGHPDAKPEADLAKEQAETGLRNEAEAYNALGALWQAGGRIAKARKSYQSALAMNRKLSAAQYNLAVLAVQQRHYAEAVDILASLIQADPAFPEAGRELDCARKGQALSQTHDGQAKRRLRQEAIGCAI